MERGMKEILLARYDDTTAGFDPDDFATAAQGALADSAVQPSDMATVATSGDYGDLTGAPALATVATSGAYTDLTDLPTLGTAAATDATDYATTVQGALADTAVQPEDLADVATSGDYADLTGTPEESSTIKVAVLGDSLSAQNVISATAWPGVLERGLNYLGGDVRVSNFAINGHSFHRAQTVETHNGTTALQACIEEAPDVVVVALGFNDTVSDVDSRSLATVESDATSLFSSLRTALPDALILHAATRPYDATNATAGSLENRNVIPSMFTLPSSGILAGAYGSEMLEDSVSAAVEADVSDWIDLTATVAGLGTVDDQFVIDYWRVARLGCTGVDHLHPTEFGSVLMAGYVFKALEGNAAFLALQPNLGDQNYPIWSDPDSVFTNWLSWNGSDYSVSTNEVSRHLSRVFGPDPVMPSQAWHLPYKTKFHINNDTNRADQPFMWQVSGGPPNESVSISVDGGAFSTPSYNSASWAGEVFNIGEGFTPGTATYRYKCGDEIYGPIDITFTQPPALAIADGGTGATSASGARTNLGVATTAQGDLADSAVQPSDLTLSPARPTFTNGWEDTGGVYALARYYKTASGQVFLEGLITRPAGEPGNATEQRAFTLPSGFRPAAEHGFATANQGAAAAVLVHDNGEVQIASSTGTDVFLDGIVFRAT